jgi:hypothetical protein
MVGCIVIKLGRDCEAYGLCFCDLTPCSRTWLIPNSRDKEKSFFDL